MKKIVYKILFDIVAKLLQKELEIKCDIKLSLVALFAKKFAQDFDTTIEIPTGKRHSCLQPVFATDIGNWLMKKILERNRVKADERSTKSAIDS